MTWKRRRVPHNPFKTAEYYKRKKELEIQKKQEEE